MSAGVTVEFCGGPCEGRRLLRSSSDTLAPVVAIRIPYPAPDTIWTSRPAPRYPTFRTARYVLHQAGDRFEYVHAGNTDEE